VGQAFSLDGSSGYVQIPDNDLWAFGMNSFTVELWANFNAVPPGNLGQPQGGLFIGTDEGLTWISHKGVEHKGGRGVRRLENRELYDDTLYRPEHDRL